MCSVIDHDLSLFGVSTEAGRHLNSVSTLILTLTLTLTHSPRHSLTHPQRRSLSNLTRDKVFDIAAIESASAAPTGYNRAHVRYMHVLMSDVSILFLFCSYMRVLSYTVDQCTCVQWAHTHARTPHTHRHTDAHTPHAQSNVVASFSVLGNLGGYCVVECSPTDVRGVSACHALLDCVLVQRRVARGNCLVDRSN